MIARGDDVQDFSETPPKHLTKDNGGKSGQSENRAMDRLGAVAEPTNITPDLHPTWPRTAASPSKRFGKEQNPWIDPALYLGGAEGEAVTTLLTDLCQSAEGRKRRRRKLDQERFHRTMCMVIANAFRARFYRVSSAVGYYRGKGANLSHTWPKWLSVTCLTKVVDGLASLGMLQCQTGKWGAWPGSGDCSTFSLTPLLLDYVGEQGIGSESLRMDLESVALIRLKDEDHRLAIVPENDEWVNKARANLQTYNKFLSNVSIALDCTNSQHLQLEVQMRNKARQEGSGRSPTSPETYRKALYRVFNNGDFGQGGRLYGGWWQSIPRAMRANIIIDGQPTTELDFSGFAVRAIYHQRGVDYTDDPYLLEQFGNAGLAQAHRDDVKTVMQAMINSPPGKKPECVRLSGPLPPTIRRQDLKKWIETKHSLIANAFSSQCGLRLQALDAKIAEIIIMHGAEKGIAVLPVHDSFIVQSQSEEWLESTMKETYGKVLRFTTTISKSH